MSEQYGLGSMGKPMAENLQKYLAKNDQKLIFNNRTMASGDTLKSLGASPASSFGELVEKSDVVFTMVYIPSNNHHRYHAEGAN